MRSYRKFSSLTAILSVVCLLSYPILLLGCTGTCVHNCGCSSRLQVSTETRTHTEPSHGCWTNRATQKKEMLDITAQSLRDEENNPCNTCCLRAKDTPSDFVLPNNPSFSQIKVHSQAFLTTLSIPLQIPSPANPLRLSLSPSRKPPPYQLFLINTALII